MGPSLLFCWSLVIDPIIKIVKNRADITVFADDIAIVVTDHSWDDASRKANKILEDANIWAKNNALRFNPAKSELEQKYHKYS